MQSLEMGYLSLSTWDSRVLWRSLEKKSNLLMKISVLVLLGSCYGSIVTNLLTSCRGHEMGQDMATRSFDQGQIAMGLMMWAGGTSM